MNPRRSRLQALRQERHPLVALAALAFTVRLCLVVLATALLPHGGAAAGWASLCQPSGQQDVPQSHNALFCHCGATCAHGCGLAPGLSGFPPVPAPDVASAVKIRPSEGQDCPLPSATGRLSIRAPPHALI